MKTFVHQQKFEKETMARKAMSLLRQLRRLAAEAYDNIYERLTITTQLLADSAWLAQQHNGQRVAAIQELQTTYFRDVGGYISLSKLLLLFNAFSRQQWESYRFDIRAMELIYDQPLLLTEPATAADRATKQRRVAEISYHVRYAYPGDAPETVAQEAARLQCRLSALLAEMQQVQQRLRELHVAAA
jgi:hypothetical protein